MFLKLPPLFPVIVSHVLTMPNSLTRVATMQKIPMLIKESASKETRTLETMKERKFCRALIVKHKGTLENIATSRMAIRQDTTNKN